MPDGNERVLAQRRTVVACALLVAVLAIPWFSRFNPLRGLAPDRDSGIFLYVGQQLLRGQALYRDLFDNKGPLVYLVNALGLTLGGGSMWGVYLLGIGLLCLAVVLTFLGFQRSFGYWAGAAAALYYALLLGVNPLGNNAEGYVWLTQLAALFVLTRWQYDDPRRFPYVLIGLAGAAAFAVKMSGTGLWVALLAAETLIAMRWSQWRLYRRHLVSLATGAGLGLTACLVYLAATGAFRDFLRVYFAFNADYVSRKGLDDQVSSLLQGVQLIGYVPVACAVGMWVMMVVRVSSVWRKRGAPDLLTLLAVIWLPIEFVVASLAGLGGRYFYTVMPAIVLLFALACRDIASARRIHQSRQRDGRGLHVSLVSVFAIGAVVGLAPALLQSTHVLGGAVVHHAYYSRTQRAPVYPGSFYPQVVRYVRESTEPGDYVLVWGDYSQATNFSADRRTPTRFVFQPHLYSAAYGDSMVLGFLSDLRSRPPVMILDTSPSSVRYAARPSIQSVQHAWPEGSGQYQVAWRQVGAYLREHYRLYETLPFEPGWRVYVRS